MKTIKLLIVLITFVFVFSACAINKDAMTTNPTEQTDKTTGDTTDQSEMGAKLNEGNLAPDFDLIDLSGKEHLLSDYAGKKVYIKFWASWCPICLAGLEELNTLAGEDEDFVILTVVSPGYKNEMKAEAFIKWFQGVENVSNINVLLDEEGTLAQEIGLRGYPTSAFIGTDGVLVKTQPGHVSNDVITTEFESIH
ncbi:MAG: thioredoxin [Herbinix sp.]|jgi:peptide methionine sulfoxide reductase msrA/msrB|nr:thioredoxin [Herbinix sp.]